MSALPDTDALIDKLIEIVIDDPAEGQKLAEEYGLWDEVKEAIHKPLTLANCRDDVNAFIEYVIVDPETDDYAIQQPFHKEWQHLISEFNRVMIVASRGHGKSIQVIARCIWEIGRNPNIRIKIISSKEDKAQEILGTIRDMIKKSERVREVFPHLEVDDERGDTKGEFFVVRSNVTMRDPTVQAAGVLTAGAGGRADLLICDDVVDPKNALINPQLRDQVKSLLSSTWFSLVSPEKGRIIYLATPYHVLDATHDLREKVGDKWQIWWKATLEYEIQYDDDGNIIEIDDPDVPGKKRPLVIKRFMWPEKWNDETLELKRIELGPTAFTAQFLLRAMSDEDRTFPDASLERSYNRELSYIGEGIEDDWPTFGGVDLASSLGKRAAYSVVLTLARNPHNGRLRFKSIYRKKMRFTDTIAVITNEFKQHNWTVVYVESNQYQTAVEDALGESVKHMPVKGFRTGVNKNDELVGLPGLNVAFDKGLFEIPAARLPLEPDDHSDLGMLMAELQTYPGGESKDIVMALWFAYRAAVENGSSFEDAYIAALSVA